MVWALLLAVGGSLLGGSYLIPPVGRGLTQAMNSLGPNAIHDPATLVELRWRRLISEDAFVEQMRKAGFTPEKAGELFNGAQALLGPLDIVTAKRRGLIDETEATELMKRNKVTAETAKRIELISEFRPSSDDIVRFAVREVFRDDLTIKFGTDEGFPTEGRIADIIKMPVEQRSTLTGLDRMIAQAMEIGMPPEQLRYFWRAHWVLPSVQDAIEMSHRLAPEFEADHPVDEETIDTLLKAQDVMPFWIPRLKKIFETLPTRIDIRRMRGLGLIDDAEVRSLYAKQGYAGKHLEQITALAIADAVEDTRDLSKGLIEKALRGGEIDETTAKTLLSKLNYKPDDANLIVKLIVTDVADKKLDDQLDTISGFFIKGLIDEVEFTTRLDALNIGAERKDRVILEAIEKREKKRSTPPKGDIEAFLRRGFIDEATAHKWLRADGVREDDIPLYIRLWGETPGQVSEKPPKTKVK